MVDAETVKDNANQLRAELDRATGDLVETWGELRLANDPRKVAKLARRERMLIAAGRELAGQQEIAAKALRMLEDDG